MIPGELREVWRALQADPAKAKAAEQTVAKGLQFLLHRKQEHHALLRDTMLATEKALAMQLEGKRVRLVFLLPSTIKQYMKYWNSSVWDVPRLVHDDVGGFPAIVIDLESGPRQWDIEQVAPNSLELIAERKAEHEVKK